MIIIEAIVNLNGKNAINDYLEAGTCCTMHIGDKFHLVTLSEKGKELIPLNRDINIKVSLLTGELSIKYITVNNKFDLIRGSKVGEGIIKEICEVYVERDNLELLKNEINYKELVNDIVIEAEKIENCLVYEDVHELIAKINISR